jgi:hypothetical protein
MDLVSFVRSLPKHWATAPIYAKGAKMPNGKAACGKSPLGRAPHEKLSPEFTAQHIEKYPEEFKAVGVYSGARSEGLVIFDVDANLGAIEEKWGKDLENAPRITSPKKNAAKFLFVVPEEDRLTVADLSHAAAGHEGWEVLWGRQGLLFGAYKDEGEYTFTGDVNSIPTAPEWLLERMREQYRELNERKDSRKLRDSRFKNRSREEKIEIARSCLSVIEPRGANSEQFWWEIGAMIHSELPNEDGLKLWEEWSRRDNEYADDWEGGKNPCAERWENGFRSGGLGFGSLIRQADLVDRERTRFQRDGLARLVEEIEALPLKYKVDLLSGEEVIARAIELEETFENPALLDQAKTQLAQEAGRHREGAAAIDKMLDAHLTFERNKEFRPRQIHELDDDGFEYLIPGLIPKPWLLLIHADGGTGKSAMCQTLCKHISQGRPFNVHGGLVDVPKGHCLWLNGDQSERIVRRQFKLIGVESGVDVVSEWDMSWYARFRKLQGGGVNEFGHYTPGNYDLVVIDSLDGCNDSNPYEENRREYALPLKKLARRNGVDFGACTIIVIHHNNRNGSFRGTSAIRAAVDETWNMQKLEGKQLAELGLSDNTRIVTVEKSRDDREGQEMAFALLSDYTYQIEPVPEKNSKVNGPTRQMLDMLKEMRRTRTPWTVQDFVDHELLGGVHKKRAIKYSLDKLEGQKLIERCAAPASYKGKGRKPVFWEAVGTDVPGKFSSRAREKSVNPPVKKQIPSPGTDLNNKADCQKSEIVKSPDEGLLTKPGLLTNPIVVKNPSPGTDQPFNANTQRHKGFEDGVDDWNMWS